VAPHDAHGSIVLVFGCYHYRESVLLGLFFDSAPLKARHAKCDVSCLTAVFPDAVVLAYDATDDYGATCSRSDGRNNYCLWTSLGWRRVTSTTIVKCGYHCWSSNGLPPMAPPVPFLFFLMPPFLCLSGIFAMLRAFRSAHTVKTTWSESNS
jgi:hypothetical protein